MRREIQYRRSARLPEGIAPSAPFASLVQLANVSVAGCNFGPTEGSQKHDAFHRSLS